MARFYPSTPPEGRSILALVRVASGLLLTFVLVFAIAYYGYVRYTNLAPERVEVELEELVVDETGRRVSYGRSALARKGRLWILHLEGSPEEIGDAHGHLAARLFRHMDERIRELVAQRYPGRLEAWADSMRLRWDYRSATDALRASDRRELSALARALPPIDAAGPGTYHRLFLYQCFLEISQRLDDVLIEGTAFAVSQRPRNRGEDPGNLIIGRSFTADLGRDFESHRVVTFYYPDGKYPFASVGWAGLVGVVTGINARGVFVAVNPARTDDPPETGLALPLLARQLLEEADSLDQALQLLARAEVRTPGVMLLGDGVERRAVVVELKPGAQDELLVRGDEDAAVWATDHMLRDTFERDAHNDRIRRVSTSGYRYERLEELLATSTSFDQEAALAILRDRKGLNNAQLGLGNPFALENLVVTHSVVIDATAMVMWIAEGPSTLGRYRAFDLRHLLARQGSRPAPLDDLSADRLLYSEEYNDYQEAREEVSHARFLLGQGQPRAALSSGLVALALAPDVGELHRLLGDIYRELDDRERALDHYRRYLELVPGRQRDQELVRGIIEELGG